MKTDRISQWLTLGANVGVVIGIVLLVLELNRNRDMMRAQTRNELSRGLTDLLSLTVNGVELADIVVRANGGEELTPTESYGLSSQSELTFRYWENVHYQYRGTLRRKRVLAAPRYDGGRYRWKSELGRILLPGALVVLRAVPGDDRRTA